MQTFLPTFFNTQLHPTDSTSGNINSSTALTLWQNDCGYICILLPRQPIKTDFQLTTKGSEAVSASFYRVQQTMCFIGHAGWYAFNRKGILPTGPKKPSGDILEDLGNQATISVSDQNAQTVWVKFQTSKDAKPGKTECKICILVNNAEHILTVFLTVLPCTMPAPRQYAFRPEYWQHPYNSADYYGVTPFSDEHLEILKKIQTLYRDLGGYGVVASVVEEAWGGQTYLSTKPRYPSMIGWTKRIDGSFQFDYSVFDRWVELNIELGLDEKIICYSPMPWGSVITYFDQKKNKTVKKAVRPAFIRSYKKIWLQFLQNFTHHLDDKGWFEKVYIGFDERSQMGKVLDIVQSVSNRQGKHFKVSAAFNSFIGNRASFDRLDYASVGLDEIRDHATEFSEVAKLRQSEGKRTSMYTATDHYPNSFSLSQPAESYWSILYAYASGADCFLRWAFDAWVKDPLHDATHCSFPAGDCFLVYPSPRDSLDRKPQWSIRLAKLDEGVRDVNKLILMGKVPELQKEIQSLLNQIKSNYTYYTLKDSGWGVSIRTATWADDNAKQQIFTDMQALKQSIDALSLKYAALISNECHQQTV